jgi:hypothetical protein
MCCHAQLATKTIHDTMFSIRHTSDPQWKATRKTLALAFNPDAIRCLSFLCPPMASCQPWSTACRQEKD